MKTRLPESMRGCTYEEYERWYVSAVLADRDSTPKEHFHDLRRVYERKFGMKIGLGYGMPESCEKANKLIEQAIRSGKPIRIEYEPGCVY